MVDRRQTDPHLRRYDRLGDLGGVITGYNLKGADRLAATLDDAARQLGDLRDANAEAANTVESVAALTAPRRTGALAGSVVGEVVEGGAQIGSDLIYAPVIHNGWAAHHIAPQPFLLDAAERTTAQWVGAYDKAVNAALEGVEGV
jgi:hypothetical protein